LSKRAREIAILVVAADERSAYEQRVHEHVARTLGLQTEHIEALRSKGFPKLDEPYDGAVWRVVSALVRTGDLDDEAWADGEKILGQACLFELVALVGYYRLLAQIMRVFRVDE
jgi:hypothetical protein